MNWDDDRNFLENPYYRGLGPAQIRWMFTTFHMGPYQPVSWLTLGADYVIWGMNPFGYHLTNILLHALAAALFTSTAIHLGRMGADRVNSLSFGVAAGLLWALHPLRVEAVSWITERREVLAGALALLTIVCHLSGVKRWLTAIVASAAMLAKGTTVVLPALIILIDLYQIAQQRNPTVRDLLRMMLRHSFLIVLAIAIALTAVFGQRHVDAAVDLARLGFVERLRMLGTGLMFYCSKTIWPFALAPLYEAPSNRSTLNTTAITGGLLVFAISLAGILMRRRYPGVLLVTVAYLLLVLPVGGLIQVGSQIAADRYSYQPSWPISLALAGIIACVLRATPRHAITQAVVPILPAALLVPLCWKQQHIWHDTQTLWRYQLAQYPDTAIAHFNLGVELVRRAQSTADAREAETHFREALAKFPHYSYAADELAKILQQTGRIGEARQVYERTLQLDPRHAPAVYGLGDLLWQTGHQSEALEQFRKLVIADPNNDLAHVVLAKMLAASGRQSEAVHQYEAALSVAPNSIEALKGLILLLSTSVERGVRDGKRAVELSRRLSAHMRLFDYDATLAVAAAYAEAGDFESAELTAAQFLESSTPEQALRLEGPIQSFRRHERIRMEPSYP